MRRVYLALVILVLLLNMGCAGFPLPFTERRAFNFPVESSHKEVNSDCISLDRLNTTLSAWEKQHLEFIRTKNQTDAIPVENLKSSLGENCQERWEQLSVPGIKTSLFGDLQSIPNADKLRELGGVVFSFRNVSSLSGIESTLHLRTHSSGPRKELVVIYRLEDKRVLHFNYSGTDNLNEKNRRWPIDEFLGILFGTASKAIPVE